MKRLNQLICLSAIHFALVATPLTAADAPAQVKKGLVKNELTRRAPLPRQLTQLVRPSDMRGLTVLSILDTLVEKKKVRIEFDQVALEKLCKRPLKDIRITLFEMQLPLAAAVEAVAVQVNGTLEVRGNQYRIVPGRGDVRQFLTDSTPAIRNAARQMAEIEKPIDKAAACDILDFLSDKYGIPIAIMPVAFDLESSRPFVDKQVSLAVGKRPLMNVVVEIANKIKGDVIIKGEGIFIVRRD